MKDHEKLKVLELRAKYDALKNYLDEDIVRVYEVYCHMFHAASWTAVDNDDFVKWATIPPIKYMAK
jgi:hypothetical protein